jgi:hypothetical protein
VAFLCLKVILKKVVLFILPRAKRYSQSSFSYFAYTGGYAANSLYGKRA